LINKKDNEDFNMLFFEFLGTDPLKESDKGLIITGAAFVEELLKQLLERRLIGGKKSIGKLRFQQLIDLGYSVGAISRKLRDDLDIIRKIRNNAAHYSKNKVNFKKVRELNFTQTALKNKMLEDNDKNCKKIYIFVISFLLGRLNVKINKINKTECLGTLGE